MTPDLPKELTTAVQEGRSVLFLGAGASRGAIDEKGRPIPDGVGLADILTKEFLGSDYNGLDLRSVYDLACSERDVRTVQRKVFDILSPFQPAPFHLLIPNFAWAGIASTNYDLLIERAYQRAPSPLQKVVPNVKDGDGATDQLSDRSVLYVKLHGCITRYQEVTPPLIASTEQLITFRNGRNGQFGTFLEWAKTKTMIFCGYAFLDSNLRILFDEIIKEGDNRPRHYIVSKGVRPAEIAYWRDRRVIAINTTFQDFLEGLDRQISKNLRGLGAVAADSSHRTTFTRFITAPGSRESEDLRQYLQSFIEHIGPEIDPAADDPRKFYSGFELGWYPMAAELDVRQPIVDDTLSEHVLSPAGGRRQTLVVIKGHAGSGKSVALRRMCFDAATKHGRLCFFVSRQHLIIVERFEEVFRLTNLPVYLFVDNVAEHRDRILDVLAQAKTSNAQLKIIATETFNTWNISCDELEPFVFDAREMRYLSEANIKLLIGKLEQHHSLGYLESLSTERRIHELQHVHGRQLLVALLEATHGLPLVEIISKEYQSIQPDEARLLYLDICSLHRFGPPVRAGLISRIHNISFDDFQLKFFKPLEAIVVLRIDRRSGDYVYEARHSYIAHTLYETIVRSQDERFDNLVRIINKLNPNFSYDLEVIAKIVRAENLQKTLSDHAKIRQVYESAKLALGERSVLYHQSGIFELHVAVNQGGLTVAEGLLERALELEPYNNSIKHSLAEVDLKRSRIAVDPLERQAWRRSAIERASALVRKGKSPYPHHTLLKAAIDGVKEALALAESEQTDAATLRLGDSIASAEAVLKNGLQAFPNEAILLAEEGELSKVLSEAVRAETAFEKSFAANPRSTLIAKRLARIKRSKGAYPVAKQVLQKCLEFNPGAQDLHYDFAMTILESAPNADQTESDSILYHLRRSFTPGDRNRQARFWYARQLCISNRFDDARPIFRELSEAQVPFKEKTEVRGLLLRHDAMPVELVGTVSFVRDTYGFVQCDSMNLRAFFSKADGGPESVEHISVGTTVTFELGFTLRGPVAIQMAL
jgi:tetratricopeptide (TPR) repeat protein